MKKNSWITFSCIYVQKSIAASLVMIFVFHQRQEQKCFLSPAEIILNSWHWVVPENIRTPTTGGIEVLPPPPHAFENSKMLHPPCIRNSRLLYPPLFRNSRGVFYPFRISYSIYYPPPPRNLFFSLLKECGVY